MAWLKLFARLFSSRIYLIVSLLEMIAKGTVWVVRKVSLEKAKKTLEENVPKIETDEQAKQSAKEANDIFRK